MATNTVILEMRTPKSAEETPASMAQVFASLYSGVHIPHWKRLWVKVNSLSFEIANYNQAVHFYAIVPTIFKTFIESQITSQYPSVLITESKEYIDLITKKPAKAVGELRLTAPFYYPIKTFADFKELDPLSSILGVLSKFTAEESGLIQIVIEPPHFNWRRMAQSAITRGIPDPQPNSPNKVKPLPGASLIESKLSSTGYRAYIRLLVGAASQTEANTLLFNLAGAFGSFTNGEGNRLALKRSRFFFKDMLIERIASRKKSHFPRHHIFNTQELATLWHPPTLQLSGLKNISWGKTMAGEPPGNLPVATTMTEQQKKDVNFFAKAEYKNQLTTFGIKRADRRKHMYLIGKTGTGKSTSIANMAINDMRNNEGMAIIDPHGDLSEQILNYVPSYRINDVVYLEPYDVEHPFWMNPLEIKNPAHKELIASGIVAIFSKLYANSWGPRLEYILRNVMFTLLEVPDATLTMVPDLLANYNFRQKLLAKVKDPMIISFWKNEFEKMQPKLQTEAISPIQNKVGQFVMSPTIRGILDHPVSTIDLEDIMNKGKILILNLSQGKLGEDNAALLGAMFITKMQLAAMNRVNIPEPERKDFFLYVDEFQNFATTSFIKILSEARKYRLCLILANQYIGQVDEEVQKAIFGNAGTLISFLIGAQDAYSIAREMGQMYKEEDLVALGNYQIVIKLAIDGLTSVPFHAMTLPLPKSINQNKTKVLKVSKERYTRGVDLKNIVENTKINPPQIPSNVQNEPINQTTPANDSTDPHIVAQDGELPTSQVLVANNDLIREIPEALRKKKSS